MHIKIILFCLIAFNTTSCSWLSGFGYVPRQDQGNSIKKSDLTKLETGMSSQQVRNLLGPPLAQNDYVKNAWTYVFYSNRQEVHNKKVNYLEIYFNDNNTVTNWQEKQLAPININN